MSKINKFFRALCLASFAVYAPVAAIAVFPAAPAHFSNQYGKRHCLA